ncbi:MAG: flagellar basal body protein [Thermodesulfobacteriota bacterium]|nr:flagellar basal body protein [Thermodesulfobacteriota bacterium]
MLDAIGSAVSGLQAQSLKMDSTANNVANSQTEGYVPTDVSISENKQGGVRAQLQKPVAAPGVAQDAEIKQSQVDLAKEMTSLVETKNMYLANMKTMDSSEKMSGYLLDTVG